MQLLLTAWLIGGAALADPIDDLLHAGKLDAAWTAASEEVDRGFEVEAWERWVDLALYRGTVEEAARALSAHARQHPDDPDVHYLLGRLSPNPIESQRHFETALDLDAGHARTWMGLGALRRASGQPREAAEAYQRALRGDATLAEAWIGLLAITQATADPEAVRALAQAVVAAVPDEPDGWLALADSDPSRRGEAVQAAVQRAPWDPRVHAAHADWLLDQGRGEEALAAAQRALEGDPTLQDAHRVVALARSLAKGTLALDQLQALEAALEAGTRPALDALVADAPRSPVPLVLRARLRADDDPDGAVADLRRALALDDGDVEAHALLGLLRLRQQDTQEAEVHLERALQARPHDAALAVALARARLQGGDAPGAEEVAAATVSAHPERADGHLIWAQARLAQGRHAEAARDLEAAGERLGDTRLLVAAAAAYGQAEALTDAARVYDRLHALTDEDMFRVAAQTARERTGE